MDRVLEYRNLATLLVLLNFVFLASARPSNTLRTVGCPDDNNGIFDRLALGSVKDGPSPGIGHGIEDKATLGGIKVGPSHGVGHEFTRFQTLGGIKDGQAPELDTSL
ncbi:hypothetical protein L1987_46938 [Smallanthus sonchifolius]|uniref:Uncharacterized protein n=1 Tax=Smallanthus sonchifolius TaxID=185202 RepID=A0ACB9G0J2_9ASTR|nr:hypothetical protein L1987_46938 [Smallanthus sonchifolius]